MPVMGQAEHQPIVEELSSQPPSLLGYGLDDVSPQLMRALAYGRLGDAAHACGGAKQLQLEPRRLPKRPKIGLEITLTYQDAPKTSPRRPQDVSKTTPSQASAEGAPPPPP